MNCVTKISSVAILAMWLAGCSEDAEKKDYNKASIGDSKNGVFTIEREKEPEKIHFGYTIHGEVIMNGSIGGEKSTIYFSQGKDSDGNEIVVADANLDGIPDFWLLIGPSNEVLRRVPIDRIHSPFGEPD